MLSPTHIRRLRARLELWRGNASEAASEAVAAEVDANLSASHPVQAGCASLTAELALIRVDHVAALAAATQTRGLAAGKYGAIEILARALVAAATACADGVCNDGEFVSTFTEAKKSEMVELMISVSLLYGRALFAVNRYSDAQKALDEASDRAKSHGMLALVQVAEAILSEASVQSPP